MWARERECACVCVGECARGERAPRARATKPLAATTRTVDGKVRLRHTAVLLTKVVDLRPGVDGRIEPRLGEERAEPRERAVERLEDEVVRVLNHRRRERVEVEDAVVDIAEAKLLAPNGEDAILAGVITLTEQPLARLCTFPTSCLPVMALYIVNHSWITTPSDSNSSKPIVTHANLICFFWPWMICSTYHVNFIEVECWYSLE